MRFFANFILSIIRLAAGILILLFAAGIPAYFVSVDKDAVIAAGRDTPMPINLARIYFDGAKLSTAMLVARAAAEDSELSQAVETLYKEHPQWIIAGGDEPFFDAFASTLTTKIGFLDRYKMYSILSLGENRKKLLDFLSQTQSGLVKKFIELRKMTSSILPAVYTSAGAPLEASLLTSALLAQTGDFSPDFLKDLSAVMESMKSDSAAKEKFEKYCVGLLLLSKNTDWTQLRSLFVHFDSLSQVYDFAVLYQKAPSDDMKNILASGLLMCGDSEKCVQYLKDGGENLWRDFSFAFLNGEGALKFLLQSQKPIYKDSFAAKFVSPICRPIKSHLGEAAKDFPKTVLGLKIALSILGGYLFIRGFLRLFFWRRDTPKWYSPIALARGFLEGAVVSLAFFLLTEPDAFKIKIENAPAPELKFAFEKAVNTIGEETMKFETDSATLAAVGLFLVLQFTVYLVCLIRLSIIKREIAPAKLKLKLLENEENLFDLGLYIGLGGTVVSLILLTMGVVTASLMAAYASTLFGILFTATVKIVHVRKYKRKLLLEAENEN